MRFGNNQDRVKQLSAELEKAFDSMVDSGTLPAEKYMKPVFGEPNADGTRLALWYNKPNGQWVADILFSDGRTSRHTGKTRSEIISHFLQARGGMEIENQAILRENERIENRVPPGFDGSGFECETDRQVALWLQDFLHGREYMETKKYVTPADTRKMFRMLMGAVGCMKLSLDNIWGAHNLDRAYCELLDTNDEFWNFRVKALEEKTRRENAQAALLAQREAESRRDYTPEVASPYANLPSQHNPNERDIKDQSNAASARSMPIEDLRRKALFGGKVQTVPMSGTKRKL
jgi:hypothetical protein